jgi:hypothetical protein
VTRFLSGLQLASVPYQEVLDIVGQRFEVVSHEPDLLRGRLEFSATPLEDESLIREGYSASPPRSRSIWIAPFRFAVVTRNDSASGSSGIGGTGA